MVLSNLSNVKSYYINKYLSLKDFNNLLMDLIIKNKRWFFFCKKQNHLFIIKDILKKIIEDKPLTILDFNVNKLFRMA